MRSAGFPELDRIRWLEKTTIAHTLDLSGARETLVKPSNRAMRDFRIAMVAACPFPAPRGTPIRIYRIAEALASRGHAVDVFTYHLGEPTGDEQFTIHRTPRIPTYKIQDPGPNYRKLLIIDPLLTLKVTRAVRSQRYDVVHAHHFEGLLASLPSKLFCSTPVVFDVHTLLESELPAYKMGLPNRLLSRIGRSLDRRLPPMSDHVIAVSDEIRTHLLQKTLLPGERISMIPNGVEQFFLDGTQRSTRLTGTNAPCLVYAGNLAAYQGIDLLLRAFAEAHKARPSLRLKMLTNSSLGEYEGLTRQLAVRDFIDIANPEPEQLAKMLAGASVAANPRSECSGLPQKLLNYMAAGCPVVSCVGSAIHLKDGETGLVVANGDVTAFANAILRLLDDRALAERLGMNAKIYIRENLSWEKTAKSIEAVYDRLMQKSQRIQ